ncbi:hypothetical protein [Alkalimarinus coralli]|uniref:hypothetical protein n=1 Tax=Alkalimarinus coralli TaxID=2935863 RepID=UPI00202B0057|nr:hypothetical protein [Alkalimarinus coralli]
MSNFYAQINDEKICIGVSQLSSAVEHPQMISLDSYDESILGKKRYYKQWREVDSEGNVLPDDS